MAEVTSGDAHPGRQTSKVYISHERCWNCGKPLFEIDPDYFGWRYWCPACSHVTEPERQLLRRLAQRSPEAIGVVAAASVQSTFTPCRPYRETDRT